MNLGGVQAPTILHCFRCEEVVTLGVGMVLRIPGEERRKRERINFCHEIVDPRTGEVFKKGGPRS